MHWTKDLNQVRAILLVRSPFETSITFRNFKLAGKIRTPSDPEKVFTGSDWTNHVTYVLKTWLLHYRRWMSMPLEKLLVVNYESLVENPEAGWIFFLILCLLLKNGTNLTRQKIWTKFNRKANFKNVLLGGLNFDRAHGLGLRGWGYNDWSAHVPLIFTR